MYALVEMLQPIKRISCCTRRVKPLTRSQQLRGVGTLRFSEARLQLLEGFVVHTARLDLGVFVADAGGVAQKLL